MIKKNEISYALIIWAPIFLLFGALIYLLIACSHMPHEEEESDYVERVMWQPKGNCCVFAMACEWDDRISLR